MAVLILIFIPGVLRQILVGMYLNNWGINKMWLEQHNSYVNLLGNISPFLLGFFMLINPGFFVKIFVRILEKLSKDDVDKINFFCTSLALRALGAGYIVLSIISSHYFLSEIQYSN